MTYGAPEKEEDSYRDLSIGEIFGRSFDLARRSYLPLLPIFVGFGLLVSLVSTYIREITPPLVIPQNFSSMTQAQELAVADSVVRFLEIRTANYLVEWLILYFAAGLGVWKIFQVMSKKGKLPFELPTRTNFSYLFLSLLITIAVIEASIVLFFVGLLIFATMFYLSFPAAVAEGKYGFSSLGRSRNLNSGKMGKTFLVFFGIQLMVYIGARVVSTIVSLLPLSTLVAHFALNFVLALEFPLVSASMVVLYISYRQGQEKIMQRPPSLYDDLKSQPMGTPATQNVRRFCSACGAPISDDERFCHNCGAALSTQF